MIGLIEAMSGLSQLSPSDRRFKISFVGGAELLRYSQLQHLRVLEKRSSRGAGLCGCPTAVVAPLARERPAV